MSTAVQPLSYTDIQTWLSSLIPEEQAKNFPPFFQGPYIIESPDRICTITLMSGAGYSMEGAADEPQFQIRIRSDQNKQSTAESDSYLLDMLIFQQRPPIKLVSGMNLLLVTRVGGAPAPLGPPDGAYRFDYVCNYSATVGAAS
jgi:hypothetical protein